MKDMSIAAIAKNIRGMITKARHSMSVKEMRKIENDLYKMIENHTGKTADDFKVLGMLIEAIDAVHTAIKYQLEEDLYELANN